MDCQGGIDPPQKGTSSDRSERSSFDAMARLQLEALEKRSVPWGPWGFKTDCLAKK
jgi:hypothetical protein